MPVTIDNLGPEINAQYVKRMGEVEAFSNSYHTTIVDGPSIIHSEATVFDTYPRSLEIDELLGIRQKNLPWGLFTFPEEVLKRRQSPLSAYRFLPKFEAQGQEDFYETRLDSVACTSDKEREEKKTIQDCLRGIDSLSDQIAAVTHRMTQFVQA